MQNLNELKQWIKKNLLNSDGKLNPRASRIEWWKGKEDIHNKILSATSFVKSNFFPERIFCILNNITEIPRCPVCNSEVSYSKQHKRYSIYCSRKCITNDTEIIKKRNNTMISKYGYVKNFGAEKHRKKAQYTMEKKYGFKNPTESEIFCQKMKKTHYEKYGGYYTSTDEYQQSRSQTCLEKYGVTHWMKLDSYRDRVKKINYKGWKELSEDIIDDYDNHQMPIQHLSEKYNYSRSHMGVIVRQLGLNGNLPQNKIAKPSFISKFEIEVRDFIASVYNGEILTNVRNIVPSNEIDIYLPELNIGFECNGDYWHSDLFKHRNYHQIKTDICLEHGIKLIHIFEYVWRNKPKIIKNKIKAIIGLNNTSIYGRHTVAKKCSYSDVEKFLNQYHIQGTRKSKYNFGLFHNGEMVAVATFNKKNDGVELIRYASTVRIIGGLDKLIKTSGFKIVYTYADRLYTPSNDNIYTKTGFELVKKTSPNYVYVKNRQVITRNSAMKHKLGKLLENYNKKLSEYENMKQHGFFRIWDAGNWLYMRRN